MAYQRKKCSFVIRLNEGEISAQYSFPAAEIGEDLGEIIALGSYPTDRHTRESHKLLRQLCALQGSDQGALWDTINDMLTQAFEGGMKYATKQNKKSGL